MIKVPYEPDRNVDSLFEYIIKNIRKDSLSKESDQEDDFLILCCGSTGTGKSMLMLHAIEIFLDNLASVDYIGLDKNTFANALQKSKDSPLPRFCALDEANISKREHSSEYNKDLIDLYFSIRGLQIFHWWSNPSINMIDKPFIEERIKGVILIINKDTKRPRLYYYFTKEAILRIWEKHETLNLRLLKKLGKEFAYYRGWFKNYKGALLQPYLDIKNKRMDNKVDIFHDKYAVKEDYIPFCQMHKILQCHPETVQTYERKVGEAGLFDLSLIKVSPVTGKKSYPPSFIDAIMQYKKIKDAKRNNKKN